MDFFRHTLQFSILNGGFKRINKHFEALYKNYVHKKQKKYVLTEQQVKSDREIFRINKGPYSIYSVDNNCSDHAVFLIGIVYCGGLTSTDFLVLLLNYNLLKEQTKKFMKMIVIAITNCNKKKEKWYAYNSDKCIFWDVYIFPENPNSGDLYINQLGIHLSDHNFYEIWSNSKYVN